MLGGVLLLLVQIGQKLFRVDRNTALTHLKMQVRTRRQTRTWITRPASRVSDRIASLDIRIRFCNKTLQVGIDRRDSSRVDDHDIVPVLFARSIKSDVSASRRFYRSADRDWDIRTRMFK